MKTRRIPFDVNKAKSGAKIVTRAGYSVRIGFFDAKSNQYPIIAAVETNGVECPYSFTEQGRYDYDADEDEYSELDLFIEEEVEATDDYNPYKATVKSIADMVERYSELQSLEELKDFYNEVKAKCREAIEYDSTWNKKQDEKPADNKPKFKVGDWVVFNPGCNAHQIVRVVENVGSHTYGYDTDDGGYFHENEEGVKLWTIQDAKPGDILIKGSNIFILHFIHDSVIVPYCHVNINDGKFYNDFRKHFRLYSIDDVTLATEEQCNFFIQKMKEAGYKWDNKYKELKKINKEDKELKQINKEIKTRLMTNQELSWWLREHPEEHREMTYSDEDNYVSSDLSYLKSEANTQVYEKIVIRKNGGVWQEPLIEE